jgi:hypothetical protein
MATRHDDDLSINRRENFARSFALWALHKIAFGQRIVIGECLS